REDRRQAMDRRSRLLDPTTYSTRKPACRARLGRGALRAKSVTRASPGEDSPMRRLQVTLLAFLVCFFCTVPGRAPAQEKSNNPSPGRASGSSESGGQRMPDSRYLGRLLIGDDAPDFDLPSADGMRFRLHSVHGLEKVAVLFVQRPSAD